MKPTAMDLTFGYVFLLFDRNNTTSYNQTGTDCKSPITPSVFPSVQAYMHIILAFVGVVNNAWHIEVWSIFPGYHSILTLESPLSRSSCVCCVGLFVSYMWNGYVSSFIPCFISATSCHSWCGPTQKTTQLSQHQWVWHELSVYFRLPHW